MVVPGVEVLETEVLEALGMEVLRAHQVTAPSIPSLLQRQVARQATPTTTQIVLPAQRNLLLLFLLSPVRVLLPASLRRSLSQLQVHTQATL